MPACVATTLPTAQQWSGARRPFSRGQMRTAAAKVASRRPPVTARVPTGGEAIPLGPRQPSPDRLERVAPETILAAPQAILAQLVVERRAMDAEDFRRLPL